MIVHGAKGLFSVSCIKMHWAPGLGTFAQPKKYATYFKMKYSENKNFQIDYDEENKIATIK